MYKIYLRKCVVNLNLNLKKCHHYERLITMPQNLNVGF